MNAGLALIAAAAAGIALSAGRKPKKNPSIEEDLEKSIDAPSAVTPQIQAKEDVPSSGGPIFDDPAAEIEEDLKLRELDENRMLAVLCTKFFDAVYKEPENEDDLAIDPVVVSERIEPAIEKELDSIQSRISGPFSPTPSHRSQILLSILNSIAPGCKWDMINGVRFANGLPISGKMERVYRDIEILVDETLEQI